MGKGAAWWLIAGLMGALLALGGKVSPSTAATPTPAAPAITSPRPREAIQGQVRVLGVTDVDGFQKAALYFGFADDPTHTWFLIAEKHIPTHGGLIARWDTTAITDGDYVLLLVVSASGGRQWKAAVPVRVRNYTPIETPTPALSAEGTPLPTPSPTLSPTPTPRWPTPTPLPTNPARLAPQTLASAGGWGAGALLVILLLFGVLRRL